MSYPNRFSQVLSDITTSPYNQHTTVTTVGPTGSGKSNANLSIGYAYACNVANKMGGEWEDYFNIDNIGIITTEEIYRVMQKSKKYSFLLLDDIGVTWGSRKWQSDENQILNDILQTFRTDNTALALTLPTSFLIDKVPRSLIHYQIEMVAPMFDKGLTIGKVFKVVYKHRLNKPFQMYLRTASGTKLVRHAFPLPPDVIRIPYEEKRAQIASDLKAERLEDFKRKMEEMNAEEDPTQKLTKKDRVLELVRDVEAGIYPTLSKAVYAHNKEFPKWTIGTDYASKIKCGVV